MQSPLSGDKCRRAVTSTAKMLALLASFASMSIYLCLLPLWAPRGPYLFGHYRLVDIYAGIPMILVTLQVGVLILVAPPPKRWFYLVRGSTALAALLATLLIMDVVTAVWRIERRKMTYTEDPVLGWVRRPFDHHRGRVSRFAPVVDYQADENGFRNAPGTRRASIAFVGDSFTEAPQVEEDQTYAHLIGRRLGTQVVNLGRSGYGPTQELEVIRRYAFAYQPRLIVWQLFEGNDLQNDEDYRAWRESEVRKPKRAILQYVEDSPFGQALGLTLPATSVTIVHRDGMREAYPLMPAYQVGVDLALPKNHPVGTEMNREALMNGARLAAQRNAELLVIFVPAPLRVLAPYLEFQAAADRESYLAENASDANADYASVLGEACRRHGIPALDLFETLQRAAQEEDRGLFIPGDLHLTARGHEIVADALAKWIGSAQRDGRIWRLPHANARRNPTDLYG
jgi:hypothetical protein